MKSSTCVGLYSHPIRSLSRHLIRYPKRHHSALLIGSQMVLAMTDLNRRSPAAILISFQLAHHDIADSP